MIINEIIIMYPILILNVNIFTSNYFDKIKFFFYYTKKFNEPELIDLLIWTSVIIFEVNGYKKRCYLRGSKLIQKSF